MVETFFLVHLGVEEAGRAGPEYLRVRIFVYFYFVLRFRDLLVSQQNTGQDVMLRQLTRYLVLQVPIQILALDNLHQEVLRRHERQRSAMRLTYLAAKLHEAAAPLHLLQRVKQLLDQVELSNFDVISVVGLIETKNSHPVKEDDELLKPKYLANVLNHY